MVVRDDLYADDELATLASFREALRKRGFFKRRTMEFVWEFLALNGLVFGGVALALFAAPWWLRALGLLSSVLGGLGFGTNAHTASHWAATGSKRADSFITQYGFGFMLGVSAGFWRQKHVRTHHNAPNIVGLDGDIDIAEPFVITKAKLEMSRGWSKAAFVRAQWLVIPFALFFNGFAVQKNGWKYSLGQLRKSDHAKERPLLDLSIVVVHYVVWLLLPCILASPQAGLTIYLLRIGLMGYALFAAFAPAHFPADAIAASVRCTDDDYVLRQTATTLNFRTGAIGAFLCAGVQYQIEHHLFPTISHGHYSRVSIGVKAFCERHGYPYRTLGWGRAIALSLEPFYRPKLVHDSLRNLQVQKNMTRGELLQQLKPKHHDVGPESATAI